LMHYTNAGLLPWAGIKTDAIAAVANVLVTTVAATVIAPNARPQSRRFGWRTG